MKITMALEVKNRHESGPDRDSAILMTALHPSTMLPIGPQIVLFVTLPRDQMDQLCDPTKTIMASIHVVPNLPS